MKYKFNTNYSVAIEKNKNDDIVGVVSNGAETVEISLAQHTLLEALKNGPMDIDSLVKARREKGVTISSYTENNNNAMNLDEYLYSETESSLDCLVEKGFIEIIV